MADEVVPGMAEAIEQRRLWRDLGPTQFADAADVTLQGLRPVRAGLRRNYQHKIRSGVARALWWPDDALERLMNGEDPSTLPTVKPPEENAPAFQAKLGRLSAEARAEVERLVDELLDES